MNLHDTLESYGVSFKPGGKDGELWLCCPFCEDRDETPDTRFRLGVNEVTGKMHCFNCEMSSNNPARTFKLLMDKLDVGELEAASRAVKARKNVKVTWPDGYERIRPVSKEDDYWAYRAWRFVKRRGVTPRQIRKKKIGFTVRGRYAYRIVFPVMSGKRLKGLVCRDFTGKQKPPYKNSVGNKYLYNRPRKPWKRRAVLSEGVWDALAIERGVGRRYDSLAVLGHALTDRQLEQLDVYDEIVLWPDPDEAGMEGFITGKHKRKGGRGKAIVKQLLSRKKKLLVRVVKQDPDDDSDPSEFSPKQVRRRIRLAVPYTMGKQLRARNDAAFEE